jgi:hypothetical protein
LIKDANAEPDFNVMSWLVKFHASVAVKVLDQCITDSTKYMFFLLIPKVTGEDRLLIYFIFVVSGRNPYV